MNKASSKLEKIDDVDVERLEEKRRRAVDAEYFKLPQKPKRMMEDWTAWRTEVNNAMIDVSMKEHVTRPERKLLTSSKASKTPIFFKGDMFIHGNRVKDRYGGKPITEEDDTKTKIQKKIMESNFYLFGIPRVSHVKTNGGGESSDVIKQDRSHVRRRHNMFENRQTTVYKTDEKQNSNRRHSEQANVHNPMHKNISLHRRHSIQETRNPIDKMDKIERAIIHRRHSMLDNEQNTTHDHDSQERAVSRPQHFATTLNNTETPE